MSELAQPGPDEADAGDGDRGPAPVPAVVANALALERERARVAELERRLDSVRRSESFRIGHAIVRARHRLLFWRRGPVAKALPPPSGGGEAGRAASGRRDAVREATGSVLVIAQDQGTVEGLEMELEQLSSMFGSFTAVLLADAAQVSPMAAPSVAIEHLIPLDQWSRSRPAIDWGAYMARRVTRVVEDYAVGAVVVLSSADAEHRQAELTAALAPVALPGMPESEANIVE